MSYSYNGLNICRSDTLVNGSAGIGSALSAFVSPAKTVLLFETNGDAAAITNTSETLANITTASGGGGPVMSGTGNGYETYSDGGTNGRANQYVTGYINLGQYNPTKPGLHTDGSNYLFADGHVKWLRPSGVSYGYNALNSNNAQVTNSAEGTNGSVYAGTFSPI